MQVRAVLRGDAISCTARRILSLIDGLPDEAAINRGESWPISTELLVYSIERADSWYRAIFEAAMRKDKVDVPGELEILRPGEAIKRARAEAKEKAEREKRKAEGQPVNDPARIAAFFGLPVPPAEPDRDDG